MRIRSVFTAAVGGAVLAVSVAVPASASWAFIHPHDQLAHRTVNSRTVIVQAANWSRHGTSSLTIRQLHPTLSAPTAWPIGGEPVMYFGERFTGQDRVTFRIPAGVTSRDFVATVQGPDGHRKQVTFSLGVAG